MTLAASVSPLRDVSLSKGLLTRSRAITFVTQDLEDLPDINFT